MFAVNVAINLPVKSLFRSFTYAVPDKLNYLAPGWRVVVPFSGQKVEGFVVERVPMPADKKLLAKIKFVEAALGDEPWFDAEMLATAAWLADYYMCNLAEAMRLFIPGKTSIRRRAVRDADGNLLYYAYANKLKAKNILAYAVNDAGRALYASGALAKQAKAQHGALAFLCTAQEWLSAAELATHGITRATLKNLLQRGLIDEKEKRVLRNSYLRPHNAAEKFSLTDEQKNAVEKISAAIGKHEVFLLQGVTGSGKTEVYLRATARAVAAGKQVLLLVPEIALTAQLVQRFQAWFGESIAVAHSKLSQNERGDVWYRMRTQRAQILIGVRSAVFAPFANLGLVIIDEEHENSYKQEERPNYHAREVALARCRFADAPLVLGSATPDINSYYKAITGAYTHLRLTQRANGSALPSVEIVDMRKELLAKNYSVLSRTLQEAMVRTAAAGEQAILLLNRRGYSTFVLCRDCGQAITCPHCAVALVYHSANEDMRCHYCGNTAPVPAECPNCHSRRIKFFGSGTQKAEAELEALPEVRVLRMDQDSTQAKFAHEEILHRFAEGSYNALIGTQMVAKGHDIANVTLVGVLAADSALHLPDYRASERAFSLLTQAAGRAGRGTRPGRVIFQTYDAENNIIRLAAEQDYDAFARQELAARRDYFYPPFAQMLKISVWDRDEARALAKAQKIVFLLQGERLAGRLRDVDVAGAFPALVGKVRDLYRFNVLVKAKDLSPVKKILLASEFKEQPDIFFDVDPASAV